MAGAEYVRAGKGWFTTHLREGDRTLPEQMKGLTYLFDGIRGKSVLDVGCAEGLITMACINAGAALAHGVEIVPSHVRMAQSLAAGMDPLPSFVVADANDYEPTRAYDVVLLLAVLHKLRDPSEACRRIVRWCSDLCVIRLPPERAPVIVDDRSLRQPHDIDAVMGTCGFVQDRVTRGHLNEWCGYYRRTVP